MQISRRSWHFRVYEWFNSGYPVPDSVNLCPYVRTVLIWAPFFFAAKILWRALLANRYERAVVYGIASGGYILLCAQLSPTSLVPPLVTLNFVLLVWVAVWLACYIENRSTSPQNPSPPSAFRTLLRAYLTAIHDRVCPQIDVGD